MSGMDSKEKRSVILTGDRPTGPLHLGHYVGSLRERVKMQQGHRVFIIIADMLDGIRARRTEFAREPTQVMEMLREGEQPARLPHRSWRRYARRCK
jgi:tryptophanyl-tRNA synthetase